jgi:hypothetical protein
MGGGEKNLTKKVSTRMGKGKERMHKSHLFFWLKTKPPHEAREGFFVCEPTVVSLKSQSE